MYPFSCSKPAHLLALCRLHLLPRAALPLLTRTNATATALLLRRLLLQPRLEHPVLLLELLHLGPVLVVLLLGPLLPLSLLLALDLPAPVQLALVEAAVLRGEEGSGPG
jgi:hypothetical protein